MCNRVCGFCVKLFVFSAFCIMNILLDGSLLCAVSALNSAFIVRLLCVNSASIVRE